MQHILFFFNADGGGVRGGSESILRQIYKYYSVRECEIYVLFVRAKQFGGWENINNRRLHLLYGGGAFGLLNNLWRLKSIHFDYAYSTFTNLTGLLGFLKRIKLLKIKCLVGRESTNVFDWYKGNKLRIKKAAYKIGYPAVNVLVCQTFYMKERLIHNLPWIEKYTRVIVLPNPVDMDIVREKENEFINTDKYEPYIVTAGRCVREKAYDVLLQSFKQLRDEGRSLKLLILGDGPLLESLKEQSKQLKLDESVCFYGYAENVFPFFKHAELCVISSRLEGFPNVLLQMMSQNEKVVCTLCAGDIEKIKGLYTCVTDDSIALAKAIDDCLSSDTRKNRLLFDNELGSRTINSFMGRLFEAEKES